MESKSGRIGRRVALTSFCLGALRLGRQRQELRFSTRADLAAGSGDATAGARASPEASLPTRITARAPDVFDGSTRR
jgi:hypothetical protein